MHDIIHKINVVLVKLLYANKLIPKKSKCAGLRLCAVYIDIVSVFIIPSMTIFVGVFICCKWWSSPKSKPIWLESIKQGNLGLE